MSEFIWGTTYEKPSKTMAAKMDKICREEGGHGFTEINRVPNSSLGINNGKYQGWFSGPNRGNPYDNNLSANVQKRIKEGC